MASNQEPLDPMPPVPEEENLPVASLMRADEVAEPEIKAFQYLDLEQEEVKKEQKIRADVKEQIRKELQPEMVRKATLLKKEVYEKSHKEGYESGYQEGLEKGRKEAYEAADKEADATLSSQVKSIQKLLESMSQPYQDISQNVFESLCHLSVDLAARIVPVEIALHKEWIIDAIQEAVQKLPDDSEPIDVFLHSADLEIVDKYLQSNKVNWRLNADDDLQEGTCRIKQNSSVVMNDWKSRLDELLGDTESLFKKLAKQPNKVLNSNSQTSTPSEET